MDLDVYSSSKFVLSKIKPYLTNNAIIILDNIYNKPAWQHGEYKALTETFNEDEYRFISFGSNRESAAIKVTKIIFKQISQKLFISQNLVIAI